MPTSNTDWVKQRLPGDAGDVFVAKGFGADAATAIAAAVTAALGDQADKRLALRDLLEILRSEQKYQAETIDGYRYENPVLDARIKELEDEVDAGSSSSPGTFGSVPLTFGSCASDDEYSAD